MIISSFSNRCQKERIGHTYGSVAIPKVWALNIHDWGFASFWKSGKVGKNEKPSKKVGKDEKPSKKIQKSDTLVRKVGENESFS